MNLVYYKKKTIPLATQKEVEVEAGQTKAKQKELQRKAEVLFKSYRCLASLRAKSFSSSQTQ